MSGFTATGAAVLPSIGEPADLRLLDSSQLAALASELRAVLIETVCSTGGHLGANLGVVELTIALHRTPGLQSCGSPRQR